MAHRPRTRICWPALATFSRSGHSAITMRLRRYWLGSPAPWLRVTVAIACLVNSLAPQSAMALAMQHAGLDSSVLAPTAQSPACHGTDGSVTAPVNKSVPRALPCCAQGTCQCGMSLAYAAPNSGANLLTYVAHSPMAVEPANSAAPRSPPIPLFRPPIL